MILPLDVPAAVSSTLAVSWTTAMGATPSPDPGLRQGVDPLDVTPGVLGFLVIFAAALACIPLFRSMTTKVRRIEYLAQREQTDGAGDGEPDEPGDRPAPPRGAEPPPGSGEPPAGRPG